jgi:hypothetical protein
VFMAECQLRYLLAALDEMRRRNARRLEPKPEAQQRYVAAVDDRMRTTVWIAGGCRSWYLDATGRNSTIWPGSTWRFWLNMGRFDADAYELSP